MYYVVLTECKNMDSFDKSCNVAKHNYDECFQKWFNRFLKNRDTNLNVCDAEFREYQQCLKVWLIIYAYGFFFFFFRDRVSVCVFSRFLRKMDACSHLKEQYDTCFNTWFTQKFLKGDYDDEMCAPLLKVYTQCVKV